MTIPAIGTRIYYTGDMANSVWTVDDVWKTYNSQNQLVRTRYVASHEFCGQIVTDCDVCPVTIARGLLK